MLELISIHIPKTAGRSFHKILNEVYGESSVRYYLREDIEALKKAGKTIADDLKSETIAIHGHFYFHEVASLYQQSKAKVVTWLRDPAQRVLSNYAFFIKRLHDPPETQKEAHRLNMHRKEEPLMVYAGMEENQNVMAQFLQGLSLEDMYFVGETEHFERDIKRLQSMLGWPVARSFRENDNSSFKQRFLKTTEEELQTLRQWNKTDYDLYQRALALNKTYPL